MPWTASKASGPREASWGQADAAHGRASLAAALAVVRGGGGAPRLGMQRSAGLLYAPESAARAVPGGTPPRTGSPHPGCLERFQPLLLPASKVPSLSIDGNCTTPLHLLHSYHAGAQYDASDPAVQ